MADLLRPWRSRYGDSSAEMVARLLAAAAYMLLIFRVSGVTGKDMPPIMYDQIPHFLEYFFFALVLMIAAAGFVRDHVSPRHFAGAWLVAAAYAMTDEWHQSFVPGRDASVHDLVFDGLGSAAALVLLFLLLRRGGGGS